MKKIFILFLILTLGFILRFWHLGDNPPSLDWDEASLGYNAYSILKTGADEYGNFLPLSIRSFGDYKPPLYTYLTIPPVSLWGLNEYSTRFASALLGFFTLIVGYFLVRILLNLYSAKIPLLFTLFFAISPWHIQFSRIAFESNISLFFVSLGICLFLYASKRPKLYIASFIMLGLSLYTYHSPRLIVPLLIVFLTLLYRRHILPNKKWFVVGIICFILLILPVLKELRGSTGARFSSVSSLTPESLSESINLIKIDKENGDRLGMLTHNRRLIYAREILGGYLDHFNFDFLFLNGDPPARHHANGMGMMYLWDFIFVAIGGIVVLRVRNAGMKVMVIWLVLSPLASALTTGTPHAVRALLMLLPLVYFSTIGFNFVYTRYKKLTRVAVFFLLINFYYYLNLYWIHSPVESSSDWQYGYKQVVSEVAKRESEFDKIIVTYRYDQPYIFFLYYNLIDPSWYQKNWGTGEIPRSNRSFGKFEFRNIDWQKDSYLKNVLFVGTGDEIPSDIPNEQVLHFLDGSVAFRVVAR
ncbi:hypothetical protein A3D77_07255 [Candidatus Gottesmanbacteria bacterium RIFCSPHIGHO2_02_FULL_39_11]|uniref:Glycosyltransferase RgtA/B/C/D-like domain-containing protein n=1 Tax=Candidatus Gottesmanbacteria bacterium RIFCSPHIGHO2_02_FULL_39_11 TaxID=1798382 RepID=A0A1F5ZJZ7_9BACT|nr:MAG: hypothetical protein A3D77_07255 [Candidatus Gottesmanbacteria bacterium RIFCSPHIGHO2_02_FULL_39_11]